MGGIRKNSLPQPERFRHNPLEKALQACPRRLDESDSGPRARESRKQHRVQIYGPAGESAGDPPQPFAIPAPPHQNRPRVVGGKNQAAIRLEEPMHVFQTSPASIGRQHEIDAVESEDYRVERFLLEQGKVRRIHNPEILVGELSLTGLEHRWCVIYTDIA